MRKTNWLAILIVGLVSGVALASLLASAKVPVILAIPIIGGGVLLYLIIRNWRI